MTGSPFSSVFGGPMMAMSTSSVFSSCSSAFLSCSSAFLLSSSIFSYSLSLISLVFVIMAKVKNPDTKRVVPSSGWRAGSYTA